MSVPPTQLVAPLVDARLTSSHSEAETSVVNPSTGQRLLVIPSGCDIDANDAVSSARLAFESGAWSESPPSFKKQVLHRWADLMQREAVELDRLDAEEMGKPVSVTFCNASAAASLVRFFAEAVDKVAGDVFASDRSSLVSQRRVPRGVVAAIVPWNFPTFNATLKIAPGLAAGNCVVLKPSELSSRSAIRIALLALEAGLPSGVFNVVPGLGQTVGRALALHPNVDMLAFTGSTAVGKLMLQYAGQSNMKVVQAECGGKSPQIVFADGVDLDAASVTIADFLLINQGQICSVGSRLLLQKSIEGIVLEKVSTHLKRIVAGEAIDPVTTFGPLVSAKQRDRVMNYIETAGADGAQLVTGGSRMLGSSGGYFVEPTVFREVPRSARIAQEEIFGPVLSVASFEHEEEAIGLANSTPYGLSAYVWTANLSTGMRMARAIRSEVVINAAAPTGEGAGYAASSEPLGHSGLGTEGGLAGMETYLRRQLVWFNYGR